MSDSEPPVSGRSLLVSIHDVGPRFAAEVETLAERLSRLLDGPRFAMLVVPDHWDAAPLARDPGFARVLRNWADQGVEMFLHGWRHRDDSMHGALIAGLKARHMTAGEGEFLGLGFDEALARMHAGREVVEQAIGRSVAGFVAPAWLYGTGALAAARAAGFRIAEDHLRVWDPVTGQTLARGPVVTWASRSRARTASSLFAAAVARTVLPLTATIRVAVHPGDTTKPSLLASIDRTVARYSKSHPPRRYADLLR